VDEGDEVITTPVTCVATNMPILLAKANPVWADINPYTGNIEPKSIAQRVTEKTKAIVIVDWGGLPCDLDEISSIASEYQIPVIEDAAHALGAEYGNRKIGAHADFVCFSLQAVKAITTGDGGALVCRNADDFERAKRLSWYGIGRQLRLTNYDILEPGYKYIMNDIVAAIGIAQLAHLDDLLLIRRRNATTYDKRLRSIMGISTVPKEPKKLSSNWLYTVFVEKRDDFIEMLQHHGISASIVHKRNDHYSVFRPFLREDLPGVDKFSETMACIPVGHWVSQEDVYFISDAIQEGW
jgi:dTDP-4-amino-4,6-dideoxygalactose transaminase